MAEISKITLPSGNTYDLKDATAREMISGGVSFIIAWDGASTPTVANIPYGVQVVYQGTTYTGTLAAEGEGGAQPGAFYLVKSSSTPSGQTLDIYDEYVPVGVTGSKTWEKIGDTQIDLSDVVTEVTLNKQTTNFVTGYSSPTSDSVIGADATFSVTQPTISVTPSTTYVKATASGTAVGANGTANAVTGYASPSTDTFVKSVTAETDKNLVTTTVPNVTGNTSVTIPNVTGNTSVSIPNVTGNTSVSIPNVTGNVDRDLKFELGSGADSETLIISIYEGSTKVTSSNTYSASDTTLGSNLTATNTTLGSNLTATNTTLGTALTATNTTLGTAITVATGATSTEGTGDPVVTGVTVGTSGSAITALGSPSTATVLTGVKVTTQPTIALATDSSSAEGRVQVATGISDASLATNVGVAWGSKDAVTAITGLGTPSTTAGLNNSTSITVTKGQP